MESEEGAASALDALVAIDGLVLDAVEAVRSAPGVPVGTHVPGAHALGAAPVYHESRLDRLGLDVRAVSGTADAGDVEILAERVRRQRARGPAVSRLLAETTVATPSGARRMEIRQPAPSDPGAERALHEYLARAVLAKADKHLVGRLGRRLTREDDEELKSEIGLALVVAVRALDDWTPGDGDLVGAMLRAVDRELRKTAKPIDGVALAEEQESPRRAHLATHDAAERRDPLRRARRASAAEMVEDRSEAVERWIDFERGVERALPRLSPAARRYWSRVIELTPGCGEDAISIASDELGLDRRRRSDYLRDLRAALADGGRDA